LTEVSSASTSTGRPQKNSRDEEAQGRSRGGLSTKLHAAVDALGNPLRLILTGGQESEYRQAEALIEDYTPGFVIADKGYDSDAFVEAIERRGASAVIPPRKCRKEARPYDAHLYKERNLVERFFQKAKNFRGIATRYTRRKRNYQAMLDLVATVICLK
jgi:transposase